MDAAAQYSTMDATKLGNTVAVLVPIPLDGLDRSKGHWFPFIESIVQKSRQSHDQVLAQIYAGEVELLLAWEPDEQKAYALSGTRILLQGADKVGQIIWATGMDRKRWFPLIDEIERYHKEHHGCIKMMTINRPGWTPELKKRGYRVTHILAEKVL